jgi:GH15 family glucan-1,4-alpha-glucosidase
MERAERSLQVPAIEDYGVIGDCRAAALVSRAGSIDWLCWPRFDSPSIFAALLDHERGGYWKLCPVGKCSAERRYLPESNVIEVCFTTLSGTAVLTDLMPVRDSTHASMVPEHEIIRRLVCTSGEMEIETVFAPRANYGEKTPPIRDLGKLGLRIECNRGVYWLCSSTPLKIVKGSAFARISMRAGQALNFSFSYALESPAVLPPLEQIPQRIDACVEWWRRWAGQARYDGDFRDDVLRSALTLKLLSFAPSGAIIAAPTTSLPEHIGGGLNWDYRYCWLRDASLTVRALLDLGYWEEATRFLDWMLHATHLTQPELRVLYTVFGNRVPKERESKVLRGYCGSAPVRTGNAARDHLQLDVYGEVIDAAAQYAFQGGTLDRETQKALVGFGNYVVKHWQDPDQGIWEPRTEPRHHTHSRLLCWTALDRLIALSDQGMLTPAPMDEYKRYREVIRSEIADRGWNERMQTYVSELDGDELDSSLLLFPWYGFDRADSLRMRSTYRAIRNRLGTPDGLLYRYQTQPQEGAFAICSFWEAEYLALGGGTIQETDRLLRALLKYHSDLGLYGEEVEAGTGHALGNFPQAYTHVGLIGAALSLNQRQKGERQLAHRRESATAQPSHPRGA